MSMKFDEEQYSSFQIIIQKKLDASKFNLILKSDTTILLSSALAGQSI